MIGIYNYTVVLTYTSLISAITGILLAVNNHPFYAIICLLVSGLCDMFDGKVARTKKSDLREQSFGIQIDSLCDVIAFGVLPVTIAIGLGLRDIKFLPIYALFVLCAVIRLAYFNVLAEETKGKPKQKLKFYTGLPVTSDALILPFIYIFKPYTSHFNTIYLTALVIIAVLFVSKFKIKKPSTKLMIAFILLGLIEVTLIILGLLGVI